MELIFRGSRYQQRDQAEGDYLNCPMNKDEYETLPGKSAV